MKNASSASPIIWRALWRKSSRPLRPVLPTNASFPFELVVTSESDLSSTSALQPHPFNIVLKSLIWRCKFSIIRRTSHAPKPDATEDDDKLFSSKSSIAASICNVFALFLDLFASKMLCNLLLTFFLFLRSYGVFITGGWCSLRWMQVSFITYR